ncbi:L,D-transpeptidase family protein [Pseudoduganella buxea]|nr:L,D-transpeptidase family protein [Pseudoduganella buxea]
MTRSGRRVFVAWMLAWAAGASVALAPDNAPQLRRLLAELPTAGVEAGHEAAATQRFYALRGGVPAWTSTADAQAALAMLVHADDDGLEPADYRLRPLPGAGDGGAGDAARHDIALTGAMLRYITDLHAGRTRGTVRSADPRPAAAFDAAALLEGALALGRLEELRANAAPTLAIYGRLRTALQRHRAMAAGGDTAVTLPAGRPLAAGDDGAGALARRLAELGDLPPSAAEVADGRYSDQVAAAVMAFQRRHGLREDGVAGPATVAALNVPLRQRVRQIALAMERLRWLPPLPLGRLVVVNLPSYRLWAIDRREQGGRPLLDMRVIVGKAAGTPTPVFIGTMRYVEFNPYWNVPRSIAIHELLPRLARDAGYLRRHDMELVGTGAQGTGRADLAALRSGTLRIRQRPGPSNALGPVKFGLPNAMNIYLHGTPARELFDAARRDFSHGCIRVEDPAALAGFVLADPVHWHADAVARAMAPGAVRVVQLQTPVPVVIFYATAVAQDDGTVTFLEDVYGLDRKLGAAWDRARP